MSNVGKKLLVWLLVYLVIFAAHAFLVRTMYMEITSAPDLGETFVAWMYLMMILDFPLSMLVLPVDAVFQVTTSPRSELFVSLFFLFVGTLNWVFLVLIVRRYSLHKHLFQCRIISLCLLYGIIIGISTLTTVVFCHGWFGLLDCFDGHCPCFYWGFWGGFVLSIAVHIYTDRCKVVF